ncbi:MULTISPECIES: class D beta-lactamase [Cyanophyceae]|uniref:Beta-lactamase n=1 Tax=Nodularia spumigena CENA596 TaxID=1819295 RepID=A0A166KT31_NODSP|nr:MULTISPECIES: class D beta-lactamase [Cyanophyceae]MDB9355006.1 class D beta-lactamase [Nodularia spumigena CS-587/03]KZL51516.1 class D beta-lactamase [Nodularia spumigena CENA596]MDB9304936.1 class D beta-lactamase [Nodularia spumigena CS-591/12]MDB9318943.1 class D beta-lactamase [Nodularia spumigena CS-590/01A]MDB9322699.1 class D beta-lactamase [Nodularia spumigena CS-591/07A]
MHARFRFGILGMIACISTSAILWQTMELGFSLPKKSTIENVARGDKAQKVDFTKHFRELGVDGAIIIYDWQNDRIFEHNPQRNQRAFLPASTFKILNSLIALETGVITDEIAVLTWDGIPRTLTEWNRDLNMKEAFKVSAVWFYQVLARRIGYERMQEWVAKAGYGNQKIGNKDDIDTFWLAGEVQITPQQQIDFLRRLYDNELPFSERSLAIVKDIMVMEQTPDYTIRAKTGWLGFNDKVTPQIGWYVGYLEKGNNVYFFSTNIDIRQQQDGAARIQLTRRCLQQLGVL